MTNLDTLTRLFAGYTNFTVTGVDTDRHSSRKADGFNDFVTVLEWFVKLGSAHGGPYQRLVVVASSKEGVLVETFDGDGNVGLGGLINFYAKE